MEFESCIHELLDILKREIQSFNTVSELLILEEKCLVEFNTTELADILERQEDVFSSIACLEKSRAKVMVRIGEQTGREPETLSLKKLAKLTENPLKKKLIETGHILDAIYGDIKKKKSSNAMLIKQGIMLVESDIRVIMKTLGNPDNTMTGYSANAKPDQLSGGVRIDDRM
ncbi:flagellar export chaperone FlgN [Candidatus Latescibacterota bacterium]